MFWPTHWMSFQAFSKVVWRLPTKVFRAKTIWSSAFFARGLRQTGFFFETESGASEVIAKVLKVDLPVARESYRISRNAFSTSGIVSQRQIEEFLKMDAEIAKISDPLRATAAFDFALQHEVNNGLGIK